MLFLRALVREVVDTQPVPVERRGVLQNARAADWRTARGMLAVSDEETERRPQAWLNYVGIIN